MSLSDDWSYHSVADINQTVADINHSLADINHSVDWTWLSQVYVSRLNNKRLNLSGN